MPCRKISGIFTYIVADYRFARFRDASNKTLTDLKSWLNQRERDLVAADRLGFEDIWIIINAFFYEVDACSIVRYKRTEGVHDEVKHLIQIKRPANGLGNIQQHAQFIYGAELHPKTSAGMIGFSH